jgi:hypothetical protein
MGFLPYGVPENPSYQVILTDETQSMARFLAPTESEKYSF